MVVVGTDVLEIDALPDDVFDALAESVSEGLEDDVFDIGPLLECVGDDDDVFETLALDVVVFVEVVVFVDVDDPE
jgi:hypothetical protein